MKLEDIDLGAYIDSRLLWQTNRKVFKKMTDYKIKVSEKNKKGEDKFII